MGTNVANALLSAASEAAHLSESDSDFESIVHQTRRSFRRRSAPTEFNRKGRKPKDYVKKNCLLLRRCNADFHPPSSEIEYLNENGLGKRNGLQIKRTWSLDKLESFFYSIYNGVPLDLIGFKFAKSLKTRKLQVISVNNATELLEQVQQGSLILIPNRDLPVSDVQRRQSLSRVPDNLMDRYEESRLQQQNLNRTTPYQRPTTSRSRNLSPVNDFLNDHQRQTSVTTDVGGVVDPVERDFGLEIQDLINVPTTDNFIIPTLPETAQSINIQLNRSNCPHELFTLYVDETITQKNLCVTFIGEDGVDGGGLTKEMFNLFFSMIENTFFKGEDCLVPFLPLNRVRKDKDKFILVGRILEHMILLTNSIPTKLSLVNLMLIGNPNTKIESKILLNDFFNFVNPCERLILKKSLRDFQNLTNKEKDILTNMFNSNQFLELPCGTDINDQINAIATDVLIDKPKQFIDLIREGICMEKYSKFWRECDFSVFLDFQKPTPDKIANCLKTGEELTNEQINVLHYLEMYIRCLDNDSLRQFVFFVTGSYQMPNYITVTFNNFVGLARRPIVSTCSNILELSSNYITYQDLKRDLNTCIFSEEAYLYNSM